MKNRIIGILVFVTVLIGVTAICVKISHLAKASQEQQKPTSQVIQAPIQGEYDDEDNSIEHEEEHVGGGESE